ncbi:MAG: hypothetical protein NXY57DRAFT_1044647 [Lentinula lateritia]|uniref:Uncharacterized protein n=1 Tax=Lentinula lateritia TaxID=40482 RepID=A0ABQ8VYY5_9AGAR|nr:MAG: hypothetical protein NXY57DRAFT_1044647 [Lentinula lateritia]KAJ4499750.1 hypothetical protein C8R41DRAFT_863733 [Lentinula lateritia]
MDGVRNEEGSGGDTEMRTRGKDLRSIGGPGILFGVMALNGGRRGTALSLFSTLFVWYSQYTSVAIPPEKPPIPTRTQRVFHIPTSLPALTEAQGSKGEILGCVVEAERKYGGGFQCGIIGCTLRWCDDDDVVGTTMRETTRHPWSLTNTTPSLNHTSITLYPTNVYTYQAVLETRVSSDECHLDSVGGYALILDLDLDLGDFREAGSEWGIGGDWG